MMVAVVNKIWARWETNKSLKQLDGKQLRLTDVKNTEKRTWQPEENAVPRGRVSATAQNSAKQREHSWIYLW